MPRSKRPFRVGLLFDWTDAACRQVLEGVVDYARGRDWVLTGSASDADGVLHPPGRSTESNVAAVSVSTTTAPADVAIDAGAVARMAAEHFLDLGFRHFATRGKVDAAFAEAIRAAGHAEPARGEANIDFARIGRPLACLAENDRLGASVIAAVKAAGLTVPHDVAVLGVGDDIAVCALADPPLSSIELGLRSLGRRAAARLERLRHGRPAGPSVRLPPLGVTVRASTDTLAVADADVASAVRFIREHAAGPLRVGDLLRAVGLDRRTLERRFQKSLGRSPAEMLRRHRTDTAARLLRTTDRPVTDIARLCGFRQPQHLAAAFRVLMGQTPSDYRVLVRGEERG